MSEVTATIASELVDLGTVELATLSTFDNGWLTTTMQRLIEQIESAEGNMSTFESAQVRIDETDADRHGRTAPPALR